MMDKINVSRLLDRIKEQCQQYTEHALFEPNDAITRRNIITMMDEYLQSLQTRRLVTDFKVICSDENNPPSIVDQNALVVDIYLQVPGLHDPLNIHYSTYGPAMMTTNSDKGSLITSLPTPVDMLSMNMKDNTPVLRFAGVEGVHTIEATFEPEHDITTFELCQITQLQLTIAVAALGQAVTMLMSINPITFIRDHHLERHFKFKVVQ